MSLLGLMCFLLAGLDIATALLDVSFTSVSWSPLVFMLLGGLFFALEFAAAERPAAGMRALVAILLGAGLLAGCAGGGSRAPACAPRHRRRDRRGRRHRLSAGLLRTRSR